MDIIETLVNHCQITSDLQKHYTLIQCNSIGISIHCPGLWNTWERVDDAAHLPKHSQY